MSEVKGKVGHTPGPLEYSPARELDDGTAECIISAPHPTRPDCGFAVATVQGFSVAETEVYARLFVAAPDMLAALEAELSYWKTRLIAWKDMPRDHPGVVEATEHCERIRAVLSKAKGG